MISQSLDHTKHIECERKFVKYCYILYSFFIDFILRTKEYFNSDMAFQKAPKSSPKILLFDFGLPYGWIPSSIKLVNKKLLLKLLTLSLPGVHVKTDF